MSKRQYRKFPSFEVLSYLLAGNNYEATAKRFEYFVAGSPDPTKRFRVLLANARKNGFLHEGERVRFPRFSKLGVPIFGDGELTPLMKSLIPRRPKQKKKVQKKVQKSRIQVVWEISSDKPSGNAILLMVDGTKKTVAIRVPQFHTVVRLDDLLEAFNLVSKGKPTPSNFVEQEQFSWIEAMAGWDAFDSHPPEQDDDSHTVSQSLPVKDPALVAREQQIAQEKKLRSAKFAALEAKLAARKRHLTVITSA